MAEATIRDVAQRAGVSVASVSRTLNSPATVRPDMRERILQAITELDYVPHAGARSLSMRLSHAIGVVLPDLHGEFFSELVRGMDREASSLGFQLLLSTMHADARLAGQALRAMRGRVDGLIVMAPHIDGEMLAAMLPPLPSLLVNTDGASGHPVLRIDNRRGVDQVISHLVATGRRNVVHIAGPEGNIDAAERVAAFISALHRQQPGAHQVVIPGDFSEGAGRAAVRRLLADETPFDALFAANDMMALGALGALREAGRPVPGKVAVVGFDDIPLARFLDLTTVEVRMADLGARAVARLVAQLGGATEAAGVELIEPALVVRGSSVAPC
jgi:LacI family transcriptional regulator